MATTPKRSRQPSPSHKRGQIELIALRGLPEVRKGDKVARLIIRAAQTSGITWENGDVIVVAQKIISKSEGRVVRLSSVNPSAEARRLAAPQKKDPRFVEVVLRESRRIVRSDRVLIVETHHGFVCANAGVDHSNVPGRNAVTLLPKDPDKSAQKLAASVAKITGKRVAVIISDTFGRPWRLGLTNVAIGAAGIPVLSDLRGQRDRNRKQLQATVLAVADEIAAAAGLLMDKSGGTPVIVIRGHVFRPSRDRATRIIRPPNEDLFR